MTLYENPSLNSFCETKPIFVEIFSLDNRMRYFRVFIEFFRQTDNYCFAFIEIRSKLSSKMLCTLEEQREREREEEARRGIKLSILKLVESNDSDARLNGTDWFRASISKRRSMDLDTELCISINTVYQFFLYPNFLHFSVLRIRFENSRGVNHRDIRLDLSSKHFKTRRIRDLFWNKFSRWWYHYLLRGLGIKVRWILSCDTSTRTFINYREKWMNALKSNILFRFNFTKL